MTTETKTTSALDEAANNLGAFLSEDAKNIFETAEVDFIERRRNFTIAAAAGAVVGVGLTALSDRATTGTLVGTGIFGAAVTAGVYNNSSMQMFKDDAASLAIAGSAVAVETAIFGCVANLLFGKSPEENAK